MHGADLCGNLIKSYPLRREWPQLASGEVTRPCWLSPRLSCMPGSSQAGFGSAPQLCSPRKPGDPREPWDLAAWERLSSGWLAAMASVLPKKPCCFTSPSEEGVLLSLRRGQRCSVDLVQLKRSVKYHSRSRLSNIKRI